MRFRQARRIPFNENTGDCLFFNRGLTKIRTYGEIARVRDEGTGRGGLPGRGIQHGSGGRGGIPARRQALCDPARKLRQYVGFGWQAAHSARAAAGSPNRLGFPPVPVWHGSAGDSWRRFPNLLCRGFPNPLAWPAHVCCRLGSRRYGRFGNLRHAKPISPPCLPAQEWRRTNFI